MLAERNFEKRRGRGVAHTGSKGGSRWVSMLTFPLRALLVGKRFESDFNSTSRVRLAGLVVIRRAHFFDVDDAVREDRA